MVHLWQERPWTAATTTLMLCRVENAVTTAFPELPPTTSSIPHLIRQPRLDVAITRDPDSRVHPKRCPTSSPSPHRAALYIYPYGNMFRTMARAATTSDVFNAIAEPQRRAILTLLRTGEYPVSTLAHELGMSQPGASKHLRVLREVGLVRDRRRGRQRLYALDAQGLRTVHEWTGGFADFWNASFDRLEAYVQTLPPECEDDDQ